MMMKTTIAATLVTIPLSEYFFGATLKQTLFSIAALFVLNFAYNVLCATVGHLRQKLDTVN